LKKGVLIFGATLFLVSVFSHKLVIINEAQASISQYAFWGLLKVDSKEFSKENSTSLDLQIVSDVVSLGGRPVTFYGINILGLPKELNQKIFSQYKNKDPDVIESIKHEILEDLDEKGFHDFTYNFLKPFKYVGLTFMIIGIVRAKLSFEPRQKKA
jgi:hypothetical protein